MRHCEFFANTDCEYFPCHEAPGREDFSCLFCYCPLYALGDRCGGDFSYTKEGVKDCSGCSVPHRRENYGRIVRALGDAIKNGGLGRKTGS